MEHLLALTPQNDEAFLREVSEELRREQIANFGKRWGRWIIGVVVVGLAAFGGWLWWHAHRQSVAAEQGGQIRQALDAVAGNNMAAAEPPLADIAQSDIGGYRATALFTQANIALSRNDLKTAAARFAEVANDEKLPPSIRNLALIRQTVAEFDTLQPRQIVDRLRPLAVKGQPFYGTAGELTAAAYLRMNQGALAAKLFSDLSSDPDVPETIRKRAVQMTGVLSAEAAAADTGGNNQGAAKAPAASKDDRKK